MHRESRLVARLEDLPPIESIGQKIFLDIETVSNDDHRGGLRPYGGDKVCGISFTFDDEHAAWYLPIRHRLVSGALAFAPIANLPVGPVISYLQQILGDPDRTWINHNVKFDAHFLAREGINIRCHLVDTKTLAQVVDMQSKMEGYGLKPLAREWLDLATDEQDEVKSELRSVGSKDFACASIDTLGRYACADVHLNRELWKAIIRRRYENIDRIWSIENELTSTLFRIEQRGLRVDREKIANEKPALEGNIARLEKRVQDLGYEVDLNSPSALVRFCIEDLGLPVVAETDKGRPSVNSSAISSYREIVTEFADPRIGEFLEILDEHRELTQFLGLYINGWEDWIDDRDVLRPMYNQTVRTGRMSCHSPNFQQLSKRAKTLIVPSAGNAFLSRDYSQIEYRVIGAICREPQILDAYRNDPDTDFHVFVANLCNIDRKPAKSINFGIAFGMGQTKLIRQLATLLGSNTAESQAREIYNSYHQRLPLIRATSRLAEQRAKARGWIRTMYGRRRALDDGFAFKAFNTAVQGTAADIVKERLNALDADRWLANEGVTVRAVVHDEVLLEGPKDAVQHPAISSRVDEILTSVDLDLGVPFAVSGGTSSTCWGEIE
jgi:DNA polymerase I